MSWTPWKRDENGCRQLQRLRIGREVVLGVAVREDDEMIGSLSLFPWQSLRAAKEVNLGGQGRRLLQLVQHHRVCLSLELMALHMLLLGTILYKRAPAATHQLDRDPLPPNNYEPHLHNMLINRARLVGIIPRVCALPHHQAMGLDVHYPMRRTGTLYILGAVLFLQDL
jgi:hypothetical protein